MDGVLVNSEIIAIQRAIKTLKYLGLKSDEEFIKTAIGTSDERTLEILNEMTDNQLPTNYNEILQQQFPSENEDYNAHRMDNLDELLEYLRKNDYQIGLCSSSPIFQIEIILKSLKLENTFDIILSGEQFHQTKPHPEIYLTAAQKLSVKPENCLVIEDSIPGVQAAKNAGMTCIALKNEYYPLDLSQADLIISNLSEVIDFLKSN